MKLDQRAEDALREKPTEPVRIHRVTRCPVERIQRHPTKKNLARRVQCKAEKGHRGPCTFPPIPPPQVADQTTARPYCDTRVHPLPALAVGECSLCNFKGCFDCLQRHLRGDGCSSTTWRPFR